jgi:hypothetical protein
MNSRWQKKVFEKLKLKQTHTHTLYSPTHIHRYTIFYEKSTAHKVCGEKCYNSDNPTNATVPAVPQTETLSSSPIR